MQVSLEWLRDYIDIKEKPADLAHKLTMAGLEVEEIIPFAKDVSFVLGITPNRADCLSLFGIARELSALSGRACHFPTSKIPSGKENISNQLSVSLTSAKLGCSRYTARVIQDIKVKPSPDWLVKRLEASGMRSINNVVDATNYVMLETGQPLHAFDASKISGKSIVLRKAKQNENFVPLDGIARKLTEEDLLICDASKPIALAGIMGGQNSEVDEKTQSLILEAAYFDPSGVRKTSKRLGLSSDSSRRFERGVDPHATLSVLHRVCDLILELAGGTATADWIDHQLCEYASPCVELNAAEANRILGTSLKLKEMLTLLLPLGIKVLSQENEDAKCEIPLFRPDLTRPIDLIEEIARLHGYDKIEEKQPSLTLHQVKETKRAEFSRIASNYCIDAGFSESVLLSFIGEKEQASFATALKKDALSLQNPLSQEQAQMPVSLLPALLQVASRNKRRQEPDLKLFSLQRVYEKAKKNTVKESLHLTGLVVGRKNKADWSSGSSMADFFDLKGLFEGLCERAGIDLAAFRFVSETYDFLHPGKSACIFHGNSKIGFLGQLSPVLSAELELGDVFVFELDVDAFTQIFAAVKKTYHAYSKYPFIERDLSLLLDESISAEKVEQLIRKEGQKLLTHYFLFDLYKGKGIPAGKKSIACTLRYASSEKTLTDNEVEELHQRVVKSLSEKLNAVLRV